MTTTHTADNNAIDAVAHECNVREYVKYSSRSGRATDAAVRRALRSFPLHAAPILVRMLRERGLPVTYLQMTREL